MKAPSRFSSTSLICFSATAAAITLAVAQPGSLAAALSDGQTERDAQLLVCGNYPEKNLVVTEKDMDDIIATFNTCAAAGDDVPIKVEHVNSVLDPLGKVSRLWRDGKVLFGRIAFDPLAAPLLGQRAVKSLSVGLGRLAANNSLALAEVSLVLKPHIQSAALLSDGDKDTEIARLRAQLGAQDCDARITELKQAGKLTPALEPAARILLSADRQELITLSDGNQLPVADAFYKFLQGLPVIVKFTEFAPGKGKEGEDGQDGLYGSATGPQLTNDQEQFLARRLGVDPAKVRATMAADAKKKGVQSHAH